MVGVTAGLIVLVIVGTTVWVYADAKQIGVRPGMLSGTLDAGPVGWAVACLLLWIVFFPLYLATRPKYVALQQRDR